MKRQMDDVVVAARDLSVHYRSRDALSYHLAVDGVSFDILPGDVLGVVGEAGSGKSTLALTVAGLADRQTLEEGSPEICGGELRVYGTDMRNLTKRKRDRLTLVTGYLAQDAAVRLNPQLTVGENVAEPIFQRDRRFNQREAAEAVATLVDSVRLPLSMLDRYPFELSSGQRQRVALAKALILEPTFLVVDEPTRGVDATVRDGVVGVLRELQQQRRFAAMVVSSDLEVVTALTRRVAVLDRGVLIGIGDLDSMLATPQHPYLRSLATVRAELRNHDRAR